MQSDLKTPNPFLDADQLLATHLVRHVEIYESLGSTNDRAKELACDVSVELPALVVARLQMAGRGRGRNTWWSADGALTFSLLLDTATIGIVPANWPQLSLATAVAVCDALALELDNQDSSSSPTSPQPPTPNPPPHLAIKWPNDVLLYGGKVCGILIESPSGSSPAKDRVIIGIGMNVNNSLHGAPRDAGRHGAAICDITGKKHNLQTVLIGVLNAIAHRTTQLRQQDVELFRAWQQVDFLAGQCVDVETGGRRIEGECVQIADDGALVINTLFGQQRIYSGTIRVVV
jgi:BirA family transcriptional regulator, biotin operon repressor / biotin---[acetyl-CoA-carboxylase] ligase